METDINIPKTKGVNFLFQNIKFHIYVYIFVSAGQLIMHNQDHFCTDEGKSLKRMMLHGSVSLIIFNSLGLFYIWCRDSFARVEFWLIYVLNLLWFIIITMDTLKTATIQPQECMEVIMSQKTFLILATKNQLELIIALILPTEFGAKLVNMASNLIFPYLLLSSGARLSGCHESGNTVIFSICFVHIFLNLLAALMNSVLMCMGRKGKKLQSFRFFIMISFISFVIVYIIILLSVNDIKQTRECVPMEYTLRSYLKISPIAIVSMLTILLSVKSDLGGDIRNKVLTQQHKNAHDNDYVLGVTSKIGGAYGVLSQANHTDKSKVAHLKQGFGTLKN